MSLNAIAKLMDLDGDQAALELTQVRVLSAIFNKVVNREILLKGGFAMRVAANSARPTKDIDLQANGASMERVQGLVRSAINELTKSNILDDVKISEPKQTETTQRWKIGGRIKGGETPVHLTIEVSRRGLIPSDLTQAIRFERQGTGVPPAIIECYSPKAIAAAKFEALSSPMREAPRDIFDLDVLISMRVEPPVHIFANKYTEQELLEKLQIVSHKLDKMDFETVKSQLLPHMPPEMKKNFGAAEWENMRLNTYLMIDQWVHEAIQIKKEEQESEPSGLRM
jgi:predicted nucleotidyltransferase component of viral defense system